MFGSQKVLRKEKIIKENDFFYIWLSYEKYKRKLNIIITSNKFTYFQII